MKSSALCHAAPPPLIPRPRNLRAATPHAESSLARKRKHPFRDQAPEEVRIMSMWRPPAKADDASV